MKKIINKIIIIFLFMQPFLDVLTSIQLNYNILNFYIASIIRILFMLFILIYMIIYKYDFKLILYMFIYAFIFALYLVFNHTLSLAINAIRIFYLPVLILFFNNEDINISKKQILILYLIYLLLLIIPSIFGISMDTSNLGDKELYLGLFNGGNELSGILLGLLPIIIVYSKDIKNIIVRIIYYLLIAISFVLVSTKTLFFGGVLVLIVYLFTRIKNKKILVGGIIGVILLSCVILPFTPVINNIKVTLDYYEIHNITDLFNIKTFDNVVYSRRLSYANNLLEEYNNSDLSNKLFGLSNINLLKDAELDLVDIFATIGLIGFIVYISIMIYIIYKYKLKGWYLFSFILFIIMSCFSGHILNKPLVAIYIALLFRLNKEVQ